MPIFHISATNNAFCSVAAPAEFDDAAGALRSGIEGAVGIVADEINSGTANASVEVLVSDRDDRVVSRSVVSLSVSSLFVGRNELDS